MAEEEMGLAVEIAMGVVLPMTLKAAIELGVLDILAGAEASLSAADIAARLPTTNPDAASMIDRMLRFLASHSLLTCTCSLVDGKRLYALAPLSKYFIPNQDGVSFAALVSLLLDKVFLDSWSELKDSVLEGGIPFNRAHGVHAFEYPAKDPQFNQLFNSVMVSHTTGFIHQLLLCYNGFQHLKQLVDVGGGLGVTLGLITAKYPLIKAINFDLPHVIHQAPTYPNVKHVGGDMFQSVPQGDAVFMKWILHDWDDEHCIKILKNCYNATPADGKVIVVDQVIPEGDNINSSNVEARNLYRNDMMMLTQNPGGKERTRDEFIALANTCGFSDITFVCSVSNFYVIEFCK